MVYTINQLARLSKVSARTLRFYDEIGLLKPAFYGDNHYRYYQEEQLLMLQQILFFRELDVPLNEIKQVLSSNDFDKVAALERHKSFLQIQIERKKNLLTTIDKTIAHLREKIEMRDAELFEGFDAAKQFEHERYLVEKGVLTQELIEASWKKVAHWKKSDWEHFKQSGEVLNQKLAQSLAQGMKSDSYEVQQLVDEHYHWVKLFWTPTFDTYTKLGQVYLEHPDFHEFYNRYHPDLAEFLVAAMWFYAKQKLV